MPFSPLLSSPDGSLLGIPGTRRGRLEQHQHPGAVLPKFLAELRIQRIIFRVTILTFHAGCDFSVAQVGALSRVCVPLSAVSSVSSVLCTCNCLPCFLTPCPPLHRYLRWRRTSGTTYRAWPCASSTTFWSCRGHAYTSTRMCIGKTTQRTTTVVLRWRLCRF